LGGVETATFGKIGVPKKISAERKKKKKSAPMSGKGRCMQQKAEGKKKKTGLSRFAISAGGSRENADERALGGTNQKRETGTCREKKRGICRR